MAGIFENPLEELAEYQELKQALARGEGPLFVSGCMDSQKAHLMSELSQTGGWTLLVTYDEPRARELFEDCRCFAPEAYFYPAKDLLFYSSDIHGNLLTKQRMRVIQALSEEAGGVIVTTVDALMDHLLPLPVLKSQCLRLSSGEPLSFETLPLSLVQMGYEKVAQVDGSGQFSIRGGIVDIFPLTEELPFRIELWGDEIDSIRTFDPESQRSLDSLSEVKIYPATELVLPPELLESGRKRLEQEGKAYEKTLREQGKTEEAYRISSSLRETLEELREGIRVHGLGSFIRYFCQDTVSFLQYIPRDRCLLFLDEPLRLREKAEMVELEFRESMSHRLEGGYLLPEQVNFLFSAKTVLSMLQTPHTLYLLGLDQRLSGMTVKKKFALSVKSANSYQNGFELLIQDLLRWKKEAYRVVLLTASRTRASRLAGDLREQYGLSAFCPDADRASVQPGEIMVTYGTLHSGFTYPLIKFAVITEGDMFGSAARKKKRKKTAYQGKRIQSFSELSVGDYVVHESHGLGIYRGMEKIEQDRVLKDYIKIEYQDGGTLYLPATRLEGIQKYAGSEAKPPKLNKLGTAEWNKTKTRVRSAVQTIARDLVELYAARQKSQGYQYGPDTVWQKEFEELFPFEETEDQLEAIEAAKQDMEGRGIMDRLICGDVGYGKTEIALRVAFKAVQEGRQVVYLVPTTILAQQHYNTFVQRMKDFPVRVDMLCRFRTPSQQKKTLADLKRGTVDIVIGTHRVLSKDVEFKNLGLLIIDEEQRFGVTHKEKIKKLKENVDVLTLTATPIPRTLHMSLIGIRDMSVLEEPPVDRLPIQTYVMEYNDEMVREAIQRELSRNGQVYYVYNRVDRIDEIAAQLSLLVPEARVEFAHGQMHEHELERIMLDFVNGEIDVLVSTTIIETGLDIPNANTIIIHDADRLGLSQLYQIRGRVGRSNRTSYAFLMYRRDKLLREEAEKRLSAIREFTELGSGIKIAMRDLELRGAGNILGAEQHGHMEAVGYDLYCKMLNEAVLALKGEKQEAEFETVVECEIDAYIPSSYIRNEYQKLDVYKRISAIETEEDYMDMQDELIDRFGELPRTVGNLLLIAKLKAMAHRAGVTELVINRQEVRLSMYQNAAIRPDGIPALIAKHQGKLVLKTGETPVFDYQEKRQKYKDCKEMLAIAQALLTELAGMMEP